MLRSLFSGISGLRTHQMMMDVTGNNIANVNTTGFKSSQTQFQDTLSQLMQAAGAPQGQRGGTNPAQVGLGVRMAAITTNFAQGSTQLTGRSTDLMVNGDGFFVVQSGGEQLYTRSGSMSFDAAGTLVTAEGAPVQGWVADANGAVNNAGPLGPLKLPIGILMPPSATNGVKLSGNLQSDSAAGTATATIDVFDAQGNARTATVSFARTSATSWDVTISDGTTTSGPTAVSFAADGSTPTAAAPITFGGVPVDISGLSGYAGTSTAVADQTGGYTTGNLQGFTLGPDGVLTGTFSNGLKQAIGQLAIATFSNVNGLEKAGSSNFRTSVNSGSLQIGAPGSDGRGTLTGGALEMSNVDLAQEFTNLVIAQRGFQANSRVITSSDELLQDLVNIKR